jgi:hypothetical protein
MVRYDVTQFFNNDDGDRLPNIIDNCPAVTNPDQTD